MTTRRRVAMSVMLEELQLECGDSIAAGHGNASAAIRRQLLKRQQRLLAGEYEWAFRRVYPRLNIVRGQILYEYPDNLPFEQIYRMHVDYGSQRVLMTYGIEQHHYSDYTSSQNNYPPRRWRHRENETPLKFELWPTPSQDGVIWITGDLALDPFETDDDVCTLDADLIVMTAAAEILLQRRDDLAPGKAAAAQRQLNRLLKEQTSRKDEPVKIGGGGGFNIGRPGIDYIPRGFNGRG